MRNVSNINYCQIDTSNKIQAADTPENEFSLLIERKLSDSKALSINDYKKNIDQIVSDLASQYGDSSQETYISISDECYDAMRRDPDYERWVLTKIFLTLSTQSRHGYVTFTCLQFGSSRADFRSESITSPTAREKRRLREKYRQQRAEKKERLRKIRQKKWLAKLWKEEAFQREVNNLRQINHKIQLEEKNEALRQGENYIVADKDCSIQIAAKRKVAAYESTFITMDIPHK